MEVEIRIWQDHDELHAWIVVDGRDYSSSTWSLSGQVNRSDLSSVIESQIADAVKFTFDT